ncbi:HAD-IA family hydrolase [Chungangia koreensis]|uniref:HAD-IA family hydrolase n=1 Tax=Chungangia koreensis TaxID=752657 RepID=A0ABV8X2F6_9LACT
MNILWDFDGTLIDTYPVYTELLYRVLNNQYEREEIYRQLKVSFGHAFHHFQMTDEQVEEFKRIERGILPDQAKPFDGVEEVLKFASMNVIMTHKDRNSVELFLKHHGISHFFTEIVSVEDGYPRKPDPASYRYLHEKYTIDLAIGDRELDLNPAKKLGISTCMFQGESVIADYRLNQYRDFFDVVKIEGI